MIIPTSRNETENFTFSLTGKIFTKNTPSWNPREAVGLKIQDLADSIVPCNIGDSNGGGMPGSREDLFHKFIFN